MPQSGAGALLLLLFLLLVSWPFCEAVKPELPVAPDTNATTCRAVHVQRAAQLPMLHAYGHVVAVFPPGGSDSFSSDAASEDFVPVGARMRVGCPSHAVRLHLLLCLRRDPTGLPCSRRLLRSERRRRGLRSRSRRGQEAQRRPPSPLSVLVPSCEGLATVEATALLLSWLHHVEPWQRPGRELAVALAGGAHLVRHGGAIHLEIDYEMDGE